MTPAPITSLVATLDQVLADPAPRMSVHRRKQLEWLRANLAALAGQQPAAPTPR